MAPKFLNLWGLKESNNNEAYDKGLISELTSNEAISEVISDLCSVVSFIVLDLVFDFTTNIRTLELTHFFRTVSIRKSSLPDKANPLPTAHCGEGIFVLAKEAIKASEQMLVQEGFHFKRSLAAHRRCCDCLTINGISHIARGKNSGNVRARRLSFGHKVARLVHIQLSLE